jgi:nitroimidazol reductase NimA-like FMN-containing flavoprotein (pyridoxamine 5'-phosphate oxidase superfamily)
MPQLSPSERDDLLQTRGVLMRIACVRADGSPLVTPIWFLQREGAIFFTPREKSEWFACLRNDARVALCIDEEAAPYRKVVAEGDAELVHDIGEDDVWRELYRAIAERYIPPDAADSYIRNTIDQPRGLYRLALESAKVRSWRMPVEGEAPQGIWHDRYYADGSKYKED